MRAIDADALKEELCKEYFHFNQRIKISPVFQMIRDAPTIETEQFNSCTGCEFRRRRLEWSAIIK